MQSPSASSANTYSSPSKDPAPEVNLVALVLGVEKCSYDTSSKKKQPLQRVMAVTNDAEMVTQLVINGKEVKQDGWYSFRRFRKLDGHLYKTPPPPSRTAIIKIAAVEHAGAAEIAAMFKTEMLKDPVTPFVTEEHAGEEDRQSILYRSCSGMLTEIGTVKQTSVYGLLRNITLTTENGAQIHAALWGEVASIFLCDQQPILIRDACYKYNSYLKVFSFNINNRYELVVSTGKLYIDNVGGS